MATTKARTGKPAAKATKSAKTSKTAAPGKAAKSVKAGKGTTTARKAARASKAPKTKAAPVIPESAKRGDPTLEKALKAAELGLEKKADNVVVLDVRGLSDYSDYVLVMAGESEPQVQAIADNIAAGLKVDGHRTIGVEGTQSNKWVLIDFGDVVAHVFYQDVREFYDIEGLWADARRIEVES